MIRTVLNLYIFLLVIDAVLSYIPSVKNHLWAVKIKKVSDFTLAPIRKILPPDLPFDVSPVIAILLIKILEALW